MTSKTETKGPYICEPVEYIKGQALDPDVNVVIDKLNEVIHVVNILNKIKK